MIGTMCGETRRFTLAALLAGVFGSGCGEPQSTRFGPVDPAFAKGGGGGSSPTVTAADPSTSPQDVRLDVRVLGTNFDVGSQAAFLLNGKATTKVITNSTTFFSSTELVADVTIAIDAVVDLYDIQVTTAGGKRGIGIEKFAISGPLVGIVSPPAGPVPPGLYGDGLGLYPGEFVINPSGGNSSFNMQPSCATGRSTDARLAWVVGGVIPNCRSSGVAVQFHLPGIYLENGTCAPPGCPIGGVPAGTSFSPTVNYYFAVDTNGDGRFGPPRDKSYNVVWTNAVYNVLRRAADGSACQWHVTAATADLYDSQSVTRVLPTAQGMALDVTVSRDDGVCGT